MAQGVDAEEIGLCNMTYIQVYKSSFIFVTKIFVGFTWGLNENVW